MPIRSNGRNTKHETLTNTLIEMISDLRPGDRVPSQNELMRRYQVSDRTVLRSLEDLRRAGWIIRRHGSGTFVADPTHRQRLPSMPTAGSTTIASLALTFGPFYQHCVDLLSVRAAAAGLSFVCQHAHDESSFDAAAPLEALHPKGFVIFSYWLLPIARRLLDRGHRVVIVGSPQADVFPEAPCVYADQEMGGHMACKHLIDLGHRHVLYAFANPRYPLRASRRWQGHERAIAEAREAGVEVASSVAEHETLAEWRSDPSRAAAYFRRKGAPTAICTWNDTEAVTLIGTLTEAGLQIPDDLSIVGFGPLPIGEDCVPPLTTIDQQVDVQLRTVMELLTRDEPPPSSLAYVVAPTFVERASTAKPSSR